ncbi:MAG: acetyl-CoA carboxylase biotin carboxylase subunit, partial [Pseudobdellovibrionaceae bacterium]
SVQRRQQKIIEEAPSPSLTYGLRQQMGEAAVKIVSKVGYRGAGTVEFLLQDGKFYFLEVNTRLQVEHTVTEEVMGVDLVKAQILTAMNQPVFLEIPAKPQGHSIECRVYAENPYMGGVPSTGQLGTVRWAEGPRRRFEYGFEEGDEITPYYDPMIAKVIVWDEDRRRAIQKMIRVLSESVVFGVHSNIPYLIEMLSHKEFGDGTMTTRFVETYFPSGLKQKELTDMQKKLFEKALPALKSGGSILTGPQGSGWSSPWQASWRGV